MNLLITGHEGFIGQNAVRHFSKKKNVKIFTSDYTNNIFKKIYRNNINCIIHLGAISSTVERNVDKVWKYNYESSNAILEYANTNNIDVIFASSASVYGLSKKFSEKSMVMPMSPYAWSKYLIDRQINKFSKNNNKSRLISLRLFNVYGPHEDHKENQMSPISNFINQAKNRKYINLFEGSDTFFRDFICVFDVIKIIEKIIYSKVYNNGIYNLGTGVSRSFQEIGELISKKYKSEIRYIPMPENIKFQYQTYTKADIGKIRKYFINKYKFISPDKYLKLTGNINNYYLD